MLFRMAIAGFLSFSLSACFGAQGATRISANEVSTDFPVGRFELCRGSLRILESQEAQGNCTTVSISRDGGNYRIAESFSLGNGRYQDLPRQWRIARVNFPYFDAPSYLLEGYHRGLAGGVSYSILIRGPNDNWGVISSSCNNLSDTRKDAAIERGVLSRAGRNECFIGDDASNYDIFELLTFSIEDAVRIRHIL